MTTESLPSQLVKPLVFVHVVVASLTSLLFAAVQDVQVT